MILTMQIGTSIQLRKAKVKESVTTASTIRKLGRGSLKYTELRWTAETRP